ncbi:MAG: nucleotidyltransferase family protein [Gammaproteobacteria bacterium]|nr:nucleotidyltransferase family protein [Gammaproteobacteria bacterium]
MKNNYIEKYLVKKSTKISLVTKMLQYNPVKLVIVVTSKNELVGSITDGDLRRGLLEGYDLNDKCSCIMNTTPSYAYNDDKDMISHILNQEKVIPIIVDKNNVVISLYHNTLVSSKTIKTNKVVIMAGGKGERLMPLTQDTPKPLLPIKDKPIIEYIIEAFIKNGFEDIIVSVGYKSEKLIEYFNKDKTISKYVSFISEKKPLDTAGALSLIPNNELDEPVIVKNGDIISNINYDDLLNFHNTHDMPITICVSEYKVSIPFGSITTKNGIVSEMVEKPTIKHYVNAGIYIINPEIIKKMKKNTPISMIELLNDYIDSGNVSAYPLHESWVDIGSPEDFRRAQKKGYDNK